MRISKDGQIVSISAEWATVGNSAATFTVYPRCETGPGFLTIRGFNVGGCVLMFVNIFISCMQLNFSQISHII